MKGIRVWRLVALGVLLAAPACSDASGEEQGSDAAVGDVADAGLDVRDADRDALGDVPDPRDVAPDLPDMAELPDVVTDGDDGDAPDVRGDLDAGPPMCAEPDAGPPLGEILGACGVLDAAVLADPGPAFFLNHIDFGDDPYDDADFCRLSEGGREVVTDENAGGSSRLSEAFSYEVLGRCEGAVLLKTENEVVYTDPMGKLTDLLVEIDARKVGVSVTRAVGFPRDDPFTVERAREQLADKLQGVLASSANVSDEDRWVKQILHVIAYGEMHADSLQEAWGQMDDETRADTIVIVTVSDGDDEWLY